MEKQLIMREDGSITEEERQFIICHNNIAFCAKSAYDFAYKMAVEIKRMRDEKLYISGGFESFGDYTEKALGMKERNAYNYIQVVEKYSEDYLQSNAKLGVTKLLLLSALSDSDREKIEAEAESDTVKELKAKIAVLKDESGKQLSLLEKEKNNEIKILKEESDKKYKQLCEEYRQVKINHEELDRKYRELQNIPARIKTVADPNLVKNLEDLKRKLAENAFMQTTLEKQLAIAKDSNMTKFSVKFEDLQKVVVEIKALLGAMTEENRTRCMKALGSVLGGLVK